MPNSSIVRSLNFGMVSLAQSMRDKKRMSFEKDMKKSIHTN